jgi:hypothetical protein
VDAAIILERAALCNSRLRIGDGRLHGREIAGWSERTSGGRKPEIRLHRAAAFCAMTTVAGNAAVDSTKEVPMFAPRLAVLLTALVGLSFISAARAQCGPVAGTGCPGAAPLICVGPPQINQMAFINYVSFNPLDMVLNSINLDGTPLLLPVGIACVPGCIVTGLPEYFVSGFGVAPLHFFVPNDPNLIGLDIYGQAFIAPAATGYSCWHASNAIKGTVLP